MAVALRLIINENAIAQFDLGAIAVIQLSVRCNRVQFCRDRRITGNHVSWGLFFLS